MQFSVGISFRAGAESKTLGGRPTGRKSEYWGAACWAVGKSKYWGAVLLLYKPLKKWPLFNGIFILLDQFFGGNQDCIQVKFKIVGNQSYNNHGTRRT